MQNACHDWFGGSGLLGRINSVVTTSKAVAAKAHRGMVEQPETSSAPEALANELVARVFVRFQRSLLRYLKDLLRRREDAEDPLRHQVDSAPGSPADQVPLHGTGPRPFLP